MWIRLKIAAACTEVPPSAKKSSSAPTVSRFSAALKNSARHVSVPCPGETQGGRPASSARAMRSGGWEQSSFALNWHPHGVYVRNNADGSIWHQAQVGSKNVGYFFGNTLTDGKQGRFNANDKKAQRGKEAGEWNTFEITCKAKNVTLWVNGAVTTDWKTCEVPSGFFGLEAEGYLIEFRNVMYKP